MAPRFELSLWIRLGVTHLVALFVLGHATPAWGQTAGTLEVLTHATIETATVAQMEDLFAITEKVMMSRRLYKFMNSAFPEQLIIPESERERFGGKERADGLSTTQVMFILNNVRPYWRYIDEYESTVTDENAETAAIKTYRQDRADFIKNEIKKKNLDAELAKLNMPTQPVLLKVKGQAVAYNGMEAFVNHPSLSEPEDKNSQLIPTDDLQQVAIDFVKGAKHSLMGNVFEFNLMKLAKAMVDAKNRGVDVTQGVDKNTAVLPDERNLAVAAFLTKELGEKFVLVDPTGLNHQKILVRDWGTPNAALLFLSGNFTQSCIGKEGDAETLSDKERPAASLPNANHAILIKGRLPALIALYQLRKTLVYKLRGESKYPIDGSYLLQGPMDKEMNIPEFVAIAFSPNGGMGSVNTDLLKQIIDRSFGPIDFMQFAMSSQAVIDAIINKMKEKIANGEAPALRMVGDPPFAMQFWSAFLEIAGIQRDEETGVYSEPKNMAIRELFKNDDDFRKFQEQIRVDPDTFGESHEKIAGVDYKLTRKIHHKVMVLMAMHMVVAGTSFNVSESAEGNTEQLMLILDKKITKRLSGALNYLYFNSPYSTHELARKKNAFAEFKDKSLNPGEIEARKERDKGKAAVKKKKAKACDDAAKNGEAKENVKDN